MSGPSALRKFAEMLMRKADSGDPRLRRAQEMGYDLENPVLHGTNKILLDDKMRHLFTAREPGLALDFTGGGRRAGSRAPGSNMHPLLLRGKPYQTDFDAFTPLEYDSTDWLRDLGVANPEAFRAKVQALNAQRHGPDSPWVADKYWGVWGHRPDDEFVPRDSLFFQFLDNPAFRSSLMDEGIDTLEFPHPYLLQDVTRAGKLKSLNEKAMGRAVLSMDPASVRSPWAAFEEPGVGLMKKKGGLAKVSST